MFNLFRNAKIYVNTEYLPYFLHNYVRKILGMLITQWWWQVSRHQQTSSPTAYVLSFSQNLGKFHRWVFPAPMGCQNQHRINLQSLRTVLPYAIIRPWLSQFVTCQHRLYRLCPEKNGHSLIDTLLLVGVHNQWCLPFSRLSPGNTPQIP